MRQALLAESPFADAARSALADVIDADLAIAEAAIADMVAFVASKARPWFEAGGTVVGEEPTVLHEAGVLAVELAAAKASRDVARCHVAQGLPGAEAALCEARALSGMVATRAASFLFAAGGTSAADDPGDFGRHWRAALELSRDHPVSEALVTAGRARCVRPRVAQAPYELGVTGRQPIASLTHATALAHAVAAAFRLDATARDRGRENPRPALDLLADSGLLGISVPTTFGGAGISHADTMEISRVLSLGDSSIGQISTIHYAMVELLNRVGMPGQRDTWFPRIVAGARIGNAAAERGVAHAKITATRLSPDPSGCLRLNGRKFYSTGSPGAALIVVLALDGDDKPISVLVPAEAQGLTILDDWHGLGQRATGSGTTILDDIAVPAENVLPRWLNADQPNVGTAAANLAHVGIDLGIAEAALDEIAGLWSGCTPDDTRFLSRIGELTAKLHASKRLFADAIRQLKQLGEVSRPTEQQTQTLSLQVSIAKVHAGELAVEAGQAVFDLGGPKAHDPDLGLDRHWRNARTHTLHDPSRWRYLRAGENLLGGRLPPRNRSS